jgi:hypothetical protein
MRDDAPRGWGAVVPDRGPAQEEKVTKLVVVLVVVLALAGGSLVCVGEDSGALGFGFGGGGMAGFFPNLDGVNAFLSENGLDPLCEFLIGGGGGGRGGVIGGMSFGGMGWGVAATSTGLDRSAEFTVGAGGFDLGFAVGGDESSVLTLGAALGGGASTLELTIAGPVPLDNDPRGVIPTPLTRTIGRAFVFVQPYVSMEAQIVSFVGLEVRIGYVVPIVGFDFGELVGIPAPSLDMSGPFVGVSIVFGGIGGAAESGDDEGATSRSSGSFDLGTRRGVSIENGVGDIVVSSYVVDSTQTDFQRIVEWTAVASAGDADSLKDLSVEMETAATGVTLHTVGDGRVDYTLRVPAGTNLDLIDGVGRIEVAGHLAAQISVTLGAGEVALSNLVAEELSLSLGAGKIGLSGVEATELKAHVGAGEITLDLPLAVSATVSASAGIGDVDVSGFPGMTTRPHRFFFTRSVNAVLGGGSAGVSLDAGIGRIEVHPQVP